MSRIFVGLYGPARAPSPGLVLPVAGIKEKVLAAHRSGIRRLVLPRANEPDLQKLPGNVRTELTVTLAERLKDVIEATIPELELS